MITCRRRRALLNEEGGNFRSEVMEDEDITTEEKRVESMGIDELPVRVHKIKKLYGKTVAVEKVSFGLEYGDCFALLGVSGAGKTTTFKCLTGEET